MNELEYDRKRWETGILHRAIDEYGVDGQLWQTLEELCELGLAICKLHRKKDAKWWDNVAEERADVGIMLDQIDIMLDTKARADAIRTEKLVRLEGRINENRGV